MDFKISVFIPVYRESSLLENLINNLLNDPYKNKELFVVIDEPTQKSKLLVEKFKKKVKFVCNGERIGKANGINRVFKESTGDVMLFLDSDVKINKESKNFLETISDEIKDADIVEIKKIIINESFLSRMVSYDYLGFNYANSYFSSRLKKCLGVNGAAFAIKRHKFEELGGYRRVISEDLDIGTRSFIKGFKFKFLKNISISTRAPSSWKIWFSQRKRWGFGAALWVKENYRDLLKIIKNHPEVLVPSLLFIFPNLLYVMITFLAPNEMYFNAIYFSLILFSFQTSLILPSIALTSTMVSLLRHLTIMIISFGIYSSIFYILAKKLRYTFNILDFLFFYFIYSPLWLVIMSSSLIRIGLNPKDFTVDWKV